MAELTITAISPDVEIRSAGLSKGVGGFVKRFLSSGDTVMGIERPLLSALDIEHLESVCYECHRRAGDIPIETQLGFELCPLIRKQGDEQEVRLRKCTGCRSVSYCGKACQKSSWSAHHSLECSVFTAVSMQIPNHMRAVLRLLLLKKAGRVKMDDWNALMACPSHTVNYGEVQRKENLAELKRMAKTIVIWTGSTFEEDTVLSLFLRVKINSVTLQTPFHDPLGLAMHPLLAKINHSCEPNCCVRFPCLYPAPQKAPGANAFSIVVVALRDIKAGEEITIPYIDNTIPVRYRRAELQNEYFFTCRCSRCLQDEQADANMDDIQRSKLFKIQDQAKKTLEGHSDNDVSSQLAHNRTKRIQDGMRSIFAYKNDWPLELYPFPQLLHQLNLVYIDQQDFSMAIQLTMLQHLHVDAALQLPQIHPLRLVHTFLLIKLIAIALDQGLTTSEAGPGFELATKRPKSEVDLELLYQRKIKEMIVNASRVWKEQPWPWMLETLNQRGMPMLQHQTVRVVEDEDAKLRALCDRALESLGKS